MTPRILTLAALATTAAALGARAGGPAQWPVPRDYRRALAEAPKADTVAFSFCGGGRLAPGARDVRVVDSTGAVLPHVVLATQRGGQTWVAFPGAKAKAPVHVYYGGGTGGPRPPSTDWRPRLSLMLRTMPLPSGAFERAEPIAAAARGDDIYGMGLVDQVHLGHNPYGPNERFASAFIGVLQIDKPGRYHLFTVSDDASYVFLDGKPLCEWPGRHEVTGARHGKHGRTIHLAKGRYRLEYYHAQDKDTAFMCLGWTPPWDLGKTKAGTPKVELVPRDAFLHTPVARARAPERRGGAPAAALRWEQADQLLYEGHQFTRIRFHPQCRHVPEGATVEWSFGDGAAAAGTAPRDHVYVGDGPFLAALRIADKEGKTLDLFRCRVPIVAPLENLTVQDEAPLREYIATIAGTRCARVVDETLKAWWELVEVSEDVRRIAPFCEVVVKQLGLDGVGWHAGDRLALALSITDPKRAERLYAALLPKAPTALDGARVRMERIEVVLHKLKDPDRALELATAMRDRGAGWQATLGQVKVGDVHRARGEFKKAEEAYRAAAKVAYAKMDRRLVALRQGGFLETVNTYLRDGFLRAARELLVQWEAKYPDGKLGGDLILMTAVYFEKLGAPERALSELTALTQMNPLSPYLPEVELRMARAHARLGHAQKAKELYEKVIYDYPRSDAARQAQQERYGRGR